jgi:dienelactone hydrolase
MRHVIFGVVMLCCAIAGCSADEEVATQLEGFERGPYSVGSTNMEVLPGYASIGDDAMHDLLLGRSGFPDERGFIIDALKHPESAWITDVAVPDVPEMYGLASGKTLPVVTYVVYPSAPETEKRPYAFPYHDAQYGVFEDMLGAGEVPVLADPDKRYPLIIIAHGASAHGVYDVQHAQDLASHGYIVAVITFGDDRTLEVDSHNNQMAFLRPLFTKAVLNSLLGSETFGTHIDADNIGITGHSFGGFTALAVAGGQVFGNSASVTDQRVTAAAIAAPWVGGYYGDNEVFGFGPENAGLRNVSIPVISFFGTKDEATPASFILPAMRKLSGSTYVIELVDQPHIFESGSWEDRNNWELLFFSAFLKHDPASIEKLRTGESIQGGNVDVQLFDYQRPAEKVSR